MCKNNVHSELLAACRGLDSEHPEIPAVLYRKTALLPVEFFSIQIDCQGISGAGLHCSAHTWSQVMLTYVLTPHVCLAWMLLGS